MQVFGRRLSSTPKHVSTHSKKVIGSGGPNKTAPRDLAIGKSGKTGVIVIPAAGHFSRANPGHFYASAEVDRAAFFAVLRSLIDLIEAVKLHEFLEREAPLRIRVQ